MTDIRSTFAQQGLIRPRDGRVLGGVCAGLGRRFGLTPWVSRLVFVMLLMVVPGSQLFVYPVLWILMPDEDALTEPAPHDPAPHDPAPHDSTPQDPDPQDPNPTV